MWEGGKRGEAHPPTPPPARRPRPHPGGPGRQPRTSLPCRAGGPRRSLPRRPGPASSAPVSSPSSQIPPPLPAAHVRFPASRSRGRGAASAPGLRLPARPARFAGHGAPSSGSRAAGAPQPVRLFPCAGSSEAQDPALSFWILAGAWLPPLPSVSPGDRSPGAVEQPRQHEGPGPAPARHSVLLGLLCCLPRALLLGLPALLPGLLPGPPARHHLQAHRAGAPALQRVQQRARREAAGPRTVPQLRRGVQLRPDAGLGPGRRDRQRRVRTAHEPGAHRGLRGGRGPAQHPARGLAHERAPAAAQLLALLPARSRHALCGVGPGQAHGPGAGRPHVPHAAAADQDVPRPAGVYLHRAHDGLLRPGLPGRDGQEPEAVGLLSQHWLVHHDPCPGAV